MTPAPPWLRNALAHLGPSRADGSAPWSLRVRIIIFFSILLLVIWLTAALVSWHAGRAEINKFFDTRQAQFARLLLALPADARQPPPARELLKDLGKKRRGKQDGDALAFALFDAAGRMVFSDGEKGRAFRFADRRAGFTRGRPHGSDDDWRVLWLPAADGGRWAAVGQELAFRDDLILDLLIRQMTPWALALPILLTGFLWMLGRELAPLRRVARELERRPPDALEPLSCHDAPPEIQPLTRALNRLFSRVTALLQRERAFISQASHELRTPLAGVRVQAEVARLARDDASVRERALDNILKGVDNCSRLTEQLLTLSRLEADDAAPDRWGTPLPWALLVRSALSEYADRAAEKSLTVRTECSSPPPGNAHPLLAVLLRNLLDNAVRYTPSGGTIVVTLAPEALTVRNSGPGVAPEHLPHLGERFFRPPGQNVPGSGLGLSIARRVAQVCRVDCTFGNAPEGGFLARIHWRPGTPPRP